MTDSADFGFLCGYDHLLGGEFGQQILDDRIAETLMVYRERNPRYVVISGAHPDGIHHSYPYSRKNILEAGVPENRIIMETRGSNTYAAFSCFFEDNPELRQGRGVIVTSLEHIPRTILYLMKVIKSWGLEGQIAFEFTGLAVPEGDRERFLAHELKEIVKFASGRYE